MTRLAIKHRQATVPARIFSAINVGKITDTDTTTWGPKLRAAKAAGFTHCSMAAFWGQLQPTQGSAITMTKVLAYLDAADAAGIKVIIDPAVHYPPSWATSVIEPYKDQAGTNWVGTPANGDAVRNWVWTATGRSLVGNYIGQLVTAVKAHHALAGFRIGAGYAGELHYAPIVTSPLQWWIFGPSCQAGTGIAAGLVPCPFPGRVPDWVGNPDAADQMGAWWLGGLTNYLAWLVAQMKTAGLTLPIWVLHPSTSVRIRPHTDLAYQQEVSQGADFRGQIASYATDPQVWPWSTWDDDTSTSTTETGMSSGNFMLEIARQNNKLALAMGENTHTNSDAAGCFRVVFGQSAGSPNHAAGIGQSWLNWDGLNDGVDTALGTVSALIAQYR